MYIYIIIATLILFLILQYIDDQRNLRNGKPLSSTPTKITLLFFITIIITVVFHLFWKEEKEYSGGSENVTLKNTYLSKIHEEIEVGLPTF